MEYLMPVILNTSDLLVKEENLIFKFLFLWHFVNYTMNNEYFKALNF